jgi:hypothetical protein
MVGHGEYIVTVEGAIINVTFIGMFNETASRKVCSYVEELINGMNGASFCMLFNMLDYEGSTPEAHVIGNQHFKWIEKQNCLGRATVVANMALVEISRNEQTSLRLSNIDSTMFETEVDAKTWLLSLL